jgi:hypothetical protein
VSAFMKLGIASCRPFARQRLRNKQQPLLSNGFANKHVSTATREYSNNGREFSTQSVPRCYNGDYLAVVVREQLGFSRCEMLLLRAGICGR